ncbi:MAG: hypothetical protein ACJ748_08140 [Flavisolibacter sp.]
MLFRVLLIALLFQCCNSYKKKGIAYSKFFKDVKIYSLEGIGEVRSNIFPNIEIVDSSNYRILKYHMNNKMFITRAYHKEKNLWVCHIFEKSDTANLYTTRIIYPDKLIELTYTDTVKHKIYDVGILLKDTMVYFRTSTSYNRKLTFKDILDIKSNNAFSIKFWYDTSGKFIKFFKSYNDLPNGLEKPLTFCYPKNNKSFFWWYESYYFQESIPCK